MEDAGKTHSTVNAQKGKYCSGHHDTAEHQADHGKEKQKIYNRLYHAKHRVFSFDKVPIPPYIQNMVQNEQYKHNSSNPLVRGFSNKHIRHLAQQQNCHYKIYGHFEYHFGFQWNRPPSNTGRPHSFTRTVYALFLFMSNTYIGLN